MKNVKHKDPSKNNRMKAFDGWYFAHRGLHSSPDIPENSLAAFRKAVMHGYGAELDVHLLRDGTLAVLHDSGLKRMTGQEGMIEDCTLADLSRLHLNGTDETVPTFRQVLELFAGRSPLIIELKTQNHNADRLSEAVCKELDSYHGIWCLESFDPYVLLWLRRNRPDIIRGQLSMNFMRERNGLSFFHALIGTHLLHGFLTRPDFIAYRFKDRKKAGNRFFLHVLKKQGVAWTLRSRKEFDQALSEGLWPIFEKFEP